MGLEIPNAEKIRCCLDQHQCTQKTEKLLEEKYTHTNPSRMGCKIPHIISVFIFFLFFISSVFPVRSVKFNGTYQKFRPGDESKKLKFIREYLKKINKPTVKTIQSPDGDIIYCLFAHQQPAFDHPKLKGQIPLDPPERPHGHPSRTRNMLQENFQVWSMSNEFCPEGTVPIRRTSEKDLLRSSNVRQFGSKLVNNVQRDVSSSGNGHEHAVGYVSADSGDEYYGAKASVNVWAPTVEAQYEFSLAQLWVISGSFGDDLNTIEAGWQVSPELYGDNRPRFFTYWTSDAYQSTGCYNLLCSGFIQTTNNVAIGAAISPTSAYSGGQFDITLLIWKDPKLGNWWLEFENVLVGYWPSFLFSHLSDSATMVQFGGEIVNSQSSGSHTSTQMGSGHFADEGFGRASYFRNLQVVDEDNNLVPVSNLQVLADESSCYNIKDGVNDAWGNYFYYGGPGRNSNCT